MRTMEQRLEGTEREAVLVEDAATIRMMGMHVLEAVPSRGAPYERTDPFILVHEGRFRLSEMVGKDTKHPHRGFDNLWYVLQGSASTGHTTGPGGSVERARLSEGSLLALRTGRGAWHAEAIGADEVEEGHGDTEFRSVLFWVNLARKDKQVEPTAQVLRPDQIPVRHEGDAIVRVWSARARPFSWGRRRRSSTSSCRGVVGPPRSSHRSSRGSRTCWTVRQRSARTDAGRRLPSSCCSVRERRSRRRTPPPGRGTC